MHDIGPAPGNPAPDGGRPSGSGELGESGALAGHAEHVGIGEVLPETKVEELAGELLEASSEQQLDQCVGKLIAIASAPGFASTPIGTALRRLLKSLARAGRGRMVGPARRSGQAGGSRLDGETGSGLGELELARRFVRMGAASTRNAMRMRRGGYRGSPMRGARRAVVDAAGQVVRASRRPTRRPPYRPRPRPRPPYPRRRYYGTRLAPDVLYEPEPAAEPALDGASVAVDGQEPVLVAGQPPTNGPEPDAAAGHPAANGGGPDEPGAGGDEEEVLVVAAYGAGNPRLQGLLARRRTLRRLLAQERILLRHAQGLAQRRIHKANIVEYRRKLAAVQSRIAGAGMPRDTRLPPFSG